MTPAQIDQLLADWQTRLNLASQNMLALQELVTYQRLAGEAGFSKAQLTGTTAVQVAEVLDGMNQVFQHFALLVATVNQAAESRKQMPRFLGSEHRFQAVETILLGPSIQLSAVQVPLAQRSLLSVAETTCTVTLDHLLDVMTRTFELAKDTILRVDLAWSHLEPKLAQADAEIQSLQHQANAFKLHDLTDLKAVQQAIAPLRDRVLTDPLGVQSEFEQQIQPLIAQTTKSLNQVLQQQQQLQVGLATARTRLQHLQGLNQQASAAYAESLEKVVDHSSLQPALPVAHLDALCQWLARLETRFAEGLVNPIQVGLENWTVQVNAALAIEQRAVTANQYPLDTRRELRGRLQALKAKALARGRAEDPMLSDLAAQANQILHSRPTDLARVLVLVTQYEKQLNSS